jgi:hypothetical protein
VVQLRDQEIPNTSRSVLLARDQTFRSQLAQGVWVHAEVLCGLACFEPLVRIAARFAQSTRNSVGKTISECVDESYDGIIAGYGLSEVSTIGAHRASTALASRTRSRPRAHVARPPEVRQDG